jgi:hypothetical protein
MALHALLRRLPTSPGRDVGQCGVVVRLVDRIRYEFALRKKMRGGAIARISSRRNALREQRIAEPD